ncbi:hypothetical protein CBM2637_B110484 [Cupriavidus taiwanensis]|nr:hypothetical protein CBM2637_B110484 [Cupriavidus taiwanensis]
MLPQPDRCRPEPGPVAPADRAAQGQPTAAVRRHGLPGLRRRPGRRRLRHPRTGGAGRALPGSQLVLEELLAVRRALRRPERVLQHRGRSIQRAGPADRRGARQLQQPAHARCARGRQGADHARAAPVVGTGTGPDVRPHRAHARGHPPQSARPCQRRGAVALPDPARHVHLHRPHRRPGRAPARAARRVPAALGPHVRGRAERAQRRHRGQGHRQRAEELNPVPHGLMTAPPGAVFVFEARYHRTHAAPISAPIAARTAQRNFYTHRMAFLTLAPPRSRTARGAAARH